MEKSESAPARIISIPASIKELLTDVPDIIEYWGISEWIDLSETTLALRVHARHLNGIVCITSDESNDTYIIEFFNNQSMSELSQNPLCKYRVKGLYSYQLLEFIFHTINELPTVDCSELKNKREGLKKGQCLAFKSF